MFRTSMTFDMRSASFGAQHRDLFPAALEMIEYADKHGMDGVTFPEHHASEDGYNPAPELMAAAAGARTKQIQFTLGAVILPLHDPVKLAERIAVTDLICGGRLHTVIAAGYAHHEFAAFRRSLKDRAAAMDHGLDIITRALAGERFMDGDREVFVRPLPFNRPPHLYVGGGVPATAKRAARFGLGLSPLGKDVQALYALYDEECRKLGREPGPKIGRPTSVYVAEDVEKAWAEIGPYMLHHLQAYSSISASAAESSSPWHGITTLEAARAAGTVNIVTPEECIELAGTRFLGLGPLKAGIPPEIGWKGLELFVQKALPAIKKMPPLEAAEGTYVVNSKAA